MDFSGDGDQRLGLSRGQVALAQNSLLAFNQSADASPTTRFRRDGGRRSSLPSHGCCGLRRHE